MRRSVKMTIKARLLMCLAALAVGMAAIGLSGWISASVMNGRMQSIIVDRVAPMQQLKAAADMYAVNIVDTAHKVRSGAVSPTAALATIATAKSTIARNWNAYRATEMTPKEQELVDQTTAALPAADAAVDKLEGLLRSEDRPGLDQFVQTELYTAIDPVNARMSSLVDLQVEVAREDGVAAAQAFRISMIVMGVIALIAAGLLAFATKVSSAGLLPLHAMTAVMRRLADGRPRHHGACGRTARRTGPDGRRRRGVQGRRHRQAARRRRNGPGQGPLGSRAPGHRRQGDRRAAGTGRAVVRGRPLEAWPQGDLTYRVNDDLPVEYEKLRATSTPP
jgi:methyl-accepting chemotaxis protein